MGLEGYITIGIILLAVILFASERLSVDLIAIGAMTALALTGVLSPREAVAGFANPATITVAAMFVLSAAVLRTGIIETIGPAVSRRLEKQYSLTTATMMTSVGSFSAFINNTPVVATFIPVVTTAAKRANIAPSKVLMPLSFGAIFGGTCTVIGTSTNLLVSGIAQERGLDGFSMFTLAPFGLVIAGVGTAYMLLIGNRLIPERNPGDDLAEHYKINDYLTEIKIPEASNAAGKTLNETLNGGGLQIGVLQVQRDDDVYSDPAEDFVLQVGDVLTVRGDVGRMSRLLSDDDFSVSKHLKAERFKAQENILVEVVLAANSELEDKTLRGHRFSDRYSANILAIRKSGRLRHKNLWDIKLHAGDVLLLHTSPRGLKRMKALEAKREAPFLSISERGVHSLKKRQLAGVAAVVTSVIALAATGIVPISIGAIAGICLLVGGGVMSMHEVYKAIDWRVIFLLAGALSFGAAMEKSGVAGVVGDLLIDNIGQQLGPIAIVAALYLLTNLCTEVMSNNAAAALLAPIAISVAGGMNVDPMPLLLAVTFAGSASFSTPVGYQTNTMVYSAGNYRFLDFTRVGAPLALILWILATLLIPVFYPF